MAEDYLYNELFNPNPRIEKKDSNSDLLNNLFSIPVKKSRPADEHKKKEQSVHQYVRLAEKSSEKVKKSVQRMKEEQTMTSEQIRQKRQFQKITSKFVKTKTEVALTGEKKVYMPTVVDPFSKPSKDKNIAKSSNDTKLVNIKPVQNKSVKDRQKTKQIEKVVQKVKEKDNENLKEKIQDKPKVVATGENQKKLKVVVKQEKIQRKQRERERQKQREKGKEKHQEAKIQPEPKKGRQSSSSSSSSSKSESQQSQWRIQLRKITGKNFKDKKYRERDQMEIRQSGIDRVFHQEKVSMKMGRLEEEEDLRREERIKRMKDKHRHH